ncbi:microsomal signal peptidase 12kDa subunit [Halteromyces radiatus]|uniref:microsomal signal peptidase 12kDa subunit n=1 Tax=Halteromyces radiatus TaxID=101107 RepID=UPI00221FB3AE|nr:microsomal signal peptidase 12kDa subunit [Halteromyces radiatus]KAI8099475.1 microsomal signal peptidase 12kDa subunit [Halteromyces radiatus]
MNLADYFEWTIDFEGQRLAENLTYYLLIAASLVGFITGYALESIQLTVSIFAIGLAATFLFVLPPWPMYRRHPINWSKNENESAADKKVDNKSASNSS